MQKDWKDELAKKTGYSLVENNSKGKKKLKAEKMSEDKILFFNDVGKRQINQDLVEKQAKEWALSFIKPRRPKDFKIHNPKLTSAQLRRFHNDVRELEAKIEAAKGKKEFHHFLPMVKMIKSKVAYACPSNGRERKVPEEFRNYMETMINSISEYEDFKAFSLCFEAVVGYFYGEGGR